MQFFSLNSAPPSAPTAPLREEESPPLWCAEGYVASGGGRGRGDELGGSLGREGGRDGKEGATKTALLFPSCVGSGLTGWRLNLARERAGEPNSYLGERKELTGLSLLRSPATRTKDSPPTNKTEVPPAVSSFFSAQEIRVWLP